MIQFNKIPVGKLDIASGQLTGLSDVQKAPKPASIGMDDKEFQNQVINLAQGKVPLEKAHQAIDSHPEIQDKGAAKARASAIYDILGGKTDKKMV